jgi:hypothetical protein
MNATRNPVRKFVLGASLASALAVVSVGAFAQEDAKAISAARAAYSAANTKISAEYKAAAAKCDGMKGVDKSVCLIDARATRSKARTDASATRDKAYAKANISGNNWLQDEAMSAASGGEGS